MRKRYSNAIPLPHSGCCFLFRVLLLISICPNAVIVFEWNDRGCNRFDMESGFSYR